MIVTLAEAGVLEVRGNDRVDLLNRLSTNDLGPLLQAGRVVDTVFTTKAGKVIDWSNVVSRADHLLVRTSAGRAAKLGALIDSFTIMEDVTTRDVSAVWRLVVVQGEGAAARLGLPRPERGTAIEHEGGVWVAGLAAYGARLEVLLPAAAADELLARAGSAGVPVGDAEQLERLRLEAGVPSPEYEFKDEVNPLELRLGQAVSWTKGCYIGQEVISRLDSYDKVARALIGFEGQRRIVADPDLRVRRGGRLLGRVTSMLDLPDGRVIGLAVVKREEAVPGAAEITGPAGSIDVELFDRPFWAAAAERGDVS